MAFRKLDTVDIIKGLIAQCTPTVIITSSEDNGDGTYTLIIYNTYWITINKRITINSLEYRITAFVINEYITIKPILDNSPIPAVNTFDLPAPYFEHGVIEMAAIEQERKKDPTLRTPFVYLIEPLNEKDIPDTLNRWGRSATPRLYFMDESISDYSPAQHKTNTIEPIRQLASYLKGLIKDGEDEDYAEVLDYRETMASDWGKFVANKGYKEKFFSDTISGLQIEFDFTMSKSVCDERIVDNPITCDIGVIMDKVNPSTPEASDGLAIAIPTGNQGALTFQWDDPDRQTTQVAIDLPVGTYSCTVTDAITGSCFVTDSITLGASVCNISLDGIVVVPPSLPGASDGTATPTVSGASNIKFKYSDGQITEEAIGLSAGLMSLAVSGNNSASCLDTLPFVVPEGTVTPDELINLVGWIKAEEPTSFNGGGITDGVAIASVDSITPATHDFAQGTAGRQQTWYEAGFGPNDTPRISSLGGDAMRGTSDLVQAFSVVIVLQPNTLDNVTRRYFTANDGSSVGTDASIHQDNGSLFLTSNGVDVIGIAGLTTTPLIIKAVFNGASSKIGINNSAFVTGDAGVAGMLNYGFGGWDGVSFVFGSADADFAEIIVYSDAKTESELDSLLPELQSKYEIVY